jgi:UDP-N-acetyl-D-mannosaminuronate dehydrogenase
LSRDIAEKVLVGANKDKIVEQALLLLSDNEEYARKSVAHNPYGDGLACSGIVEFLKAVNTINAGKVHIVKPGLDMVVRGAVHAGRLRATLTPEPADAFMIAVPTPFKGDNEPDLSYIKAAGKNIASVLKKGDLVILESTSPVGATEQLSRWLAEARPDLSFPHTQGEDADVQVAHCPAGQGASGTSV